LKGDPNANSFDPDGESLTRLLQGAAVSAMATIVIGFNWGGWTLASTVDKVSRAQSELAVVAALHPSAPTNSAHYQMPEARETALLKAESWKRRDEFPKEFVNLPGESFPSSTLVDACYTLLLAPESAELK
jgi:hypothetical protein